MRFMDIHSHILPEIDDGAKNIEESLKLLSMLKAQGVTDVVLTPHFYPHLMDAEEFFADRNKALSRLKSAIDGKDLPRVHMGCELYYFDRMGIVGDVKPFTIGNSPYILLELMMTSVSNTVIDTINNLCNMGYIPIFAHIERFLDCRGIRKILNLIKEGKCLAQVNASALTVGNPKKVFKLIKKEYIYLLGSDAHSVKNRPPYMSEALEVVSKICGEEYKKRLLANADRLCAKIFGDQNEE